MGESEIEVVIAFDGDEAGQRATDEVVLRMLNLSETETDFLRAYTIDHKPYKDCVGLLANVELADELADWKHAGSVKGLPDWWYDMCHEHKATCLEEITRRSRQVNDRGGNQYIKAFNENNSISYILEAHGVKAVPGRMVHCPKHDDSTPSLSIAKNDARAYCFNQACVLWHDGYGVDAYDLDKILNE